MDGSGRHVSLGFEWMKKCFGHDPFLMIFTRQLDWIESLAAV